MVVGGVDVAVGGRGYSSVLRIKARLHAPSQLFFLFFFSLLHCSFFFCGVWEFVINFPPVTPLAYFDLGLALK